MDTPFLAELLMRGFKFTFEEFKQYLESRFMTLIEDLRQLKDSDALVQAALAEQQQVLEAIRAFMESKTADDAKIAELLNKVAEQEATIEEAQVLVSEIKAKEDADLEAITNIYNPPTTPEPTEGNTTETTEEDSEIFE